jgi:class 3 adenylate cyclase
MANRGQTRIRHSQRSAVAAMSETRIGFATKLFLAFAALIGLALAVALLALEHVARERAEESFAARFEQTRAAFLELAALRARFVADEIDALARGNPQFRTVLSTASLAPDLGLGGGNAVGSREAAIDDAHLRLESLLPGLALAARSHVLLLLAADGRLLYAATDPERAGEDLSALALFQQTVLTGEASDVWTERDPHADGLALVPRRAGPAVYEVTARPVVFEDAVHGVVIAGTRIDAATLATLKRVAELDLALVAHGHLIASTLPPSAETALVRGWTALSSGPQNEAPLGSDYWVRTTPVAGAREPNAEFVLIASYAEERAFVRRMRASLLAVGAVILAATLAVTFTIARGITTPVRALARAARRIGRGELDAEVRIASRDELGELGDAFNEMTRGLRERDRLRRTFERYVSKEVAAEILQHPEVVPVGGVSRELTVAFVDVGGFTSLSERLGAEAVVARLNEYFDAVCRAVLARDGTVNEFVGDGVVVYWGAPIPQKDHAARACLAVLACRDALAELGASWRAAGLPETRFRIGLHTGELVVGEIGSEERRAYRAVGDAMNLAARLEGANKFYGTRILISETTRLQAGDAILAREIDCVRVVGRAQPVRIFEPLAAAGDANEAARAFAARWAEALALYRAREFGRAAHAFAALAPDAAATVLRARAERLAASPPPADWDAVHVLEAK